jgi:hypothetical protein
MDNQQKGVEPTNPIKQFEEHNKRIDYCSKYGVTPIQLLEIKEKYKKEGEFPIPHSEAEKAVAVDSLIHQMLSVKGSQWGKAVSLDVRAIKFLVEESTKVFSKENLLLELEAPIKVFGDVHGQYFDLFRLFDVAGYPSDDD